MGGNSLSQNNGVPNDAIYDALAENGSAVFASQNWWGSSNPVIETFVDGSSVVDVSSPLTSAPSLTGSPTTTSQSQRSGTASNKGGSEGFRDLIIRSEGAWLEGDYQAAAVTVRTAFVTASSHDERLAVAEAAARIASHTEGESIGVLINWVTAQLRHNQARPYALRVLAEAQRAQGNTADALAHAQRLETESGDDEAGLSHALRGLVIQIQIAVDGSDADSAVGVLDRMAALDADEAGAWALYLATAFPDVDIQTRSENKTTTAKEDGASVVAPFAVGPNPSTGRVQIALDVVAGASADVAIYDALGRQVAVLHEGAATGPLSLSFEGQDYPSGHCPQVRGNVLLSSALSEPEWPI